MSDALKKTIIQYTMTKYKENKNKKHINLSLNINEDDNLHMK